MSSKKQGSRKVTVITLLWIGVIVSLLGIIGMIITNIIGKSDYNRIGLGIMTVGFLVIFFSLIFWRLGKVGIDYFVTGAIIAYIGFILVALPSLSFSIGFKLFSKDYFNFILMGGGVLLIVFGFFAETYDLNKKLLEILKKIRISIKNILMRINWKLVFSPWNILSLAGICIIILTALSMLTGLADLFFYLIALGLILLNVVIHFRREILRLIIEVLELLSIPFRAIARAIKQIPKIVSRFAKWLKNIIIRIAETIWDALKFIVVKNYLLLFCAGIALFFLTQYKDLEIRIALSALICCISLIKPLIDYREQIGDKVSGARLYVYKTSRLPKRVIRWLPRCPYCSHQNSHGTSECSHCGKELTKCYICGISIERKDEITVCLDCGNIFHYNHYMTWLKLKGMCPICKKEVKDVKKSKFSTLYPLTAESSPE
ncbi:MAG: hypothetical protein KAS95_03015 [Candidatus Heimdallarchaeota archaeon]|nr:hypothetical protein [Candidatus Heimdallarchaeota archaeon]